MIVRQMGDALYEKEKRSYIFVNSTDVECLRKHK